MLKLVKKEVLFDTEYQEYSDLEGNIIVLEDEWSRWSMVMF